MCNNTGVPNDGWTLESGFCLTVGDIITVFGGERNFDTVSFNISIYVYQTSIFIFIRSNELS